MNSESKEHSIDIEARLIEQEHRFIKIVLNFFRRKQFQKGDPRRLATITALVYSFLAPGKAVATGIGIVSLVSLYIAWQANAKIDEQNLLISRQNELLNVQNKLSDAQRRASMNIELSAILERITDNAEDYEKKHPGDTVGKVHLGQALEARILSVLRGFKPYYSLDYSAINNPSQDNIGENKRVEQEELLTPLLSPERGQLLLALIEANVNMEDLHEKGADFSYADLKGVLLEDVFLEDVALTDADLSNGMFGNSKLSNSIIHRTNFNSSYLVGTEFIGSRCTECDFRKSDLRNSDLSYAEFFNVNFDEAKMEDISANKGYFIDSDFHNVNLGRTDFRQAHLKGSDFTGVNWEDVDLCGADLTNAKYDGTKIKSAKRWKDALVAFDESNIRYLDGRIVENIKKTVSLSELSECPDSAEKNV